MFSTKHLWYRRVRNCWLRFLIWDPSPPPWVGDLPRPTVGTSSDLGLDARVEQTSLVRGVDREESERVMVEGCCGVQTTHESIHQVVVAGEADNKTSPDAWDRCEPGPSSGEIQQPHKKSGKIRFDIDMIVSSLDVPRHTPVMIGQEDKHQDIPSLQPDTATGHTAQVSTPARGGQGMEADIPVHGHGHC